jgi:hypothetical protein
VRRALASFVLEILEEIGSRSKLQTAMPLGAQTLKLIEIMQDLAECRLCMSCAFEYVRVYISENLGSTEISSVLIANSFSSLNLKILFSFSSLNLKPQIF